MMKRKFVFKVISYNDDWDCVYLKLINSVVPISLCRVVQLVCYYWRSQT